MSELLPPNSTELERALAATLADGIPMDAPVRTLWDPWQCPLSFLPWLAWAVGVEEWDAHWPEQVQRAVVAATPEIRRHRGTVWAVREALRSAGYADATLSEGLPVLRHDGSGLHNGVDSYSAGSRWAQFSVTADIGETQGVSGAERERLLRLIRRAKPVRSVLREVAYRASVTDQLTLEDHLHATAKPALSEMRPAGLRHNGGLRYNQATQLPRESQHHDATAAYAGMNRHDGLKPFHEWQVHGARHDTVWDRLDAGLALSIHDRIQVQALYRRRAVHDGALAHGGEQPSAIDVGALRITQRRRHNARLAHDGQQVYRRTATNTYPI